MVPFHDRALHFLDDLDTFAGVGVVPDDVAEADVVRAIAFACIGQDRLSRLKIGVQVAENGEAHRGEC